MPAYPKHIAYRNRALLDLARYAPHCMSCGGGREGEMVGCHSNSLQHGKGGSYKAHDIPAYLCGSCHDQIDGRTGGRGLLPRDERDRMFLEAVYKTWLWLMESGRLEVAS